MTTYSDTVFEPGDTKALTVGDAWGKVVTLYQTGQTTQIVIGGQVADRVFFTVGTFALQIAFSETTPLSAGHVFNVGDAVRFRGSKALSNMWVKNNVAASAAVMVVTPGF